MKTRKCIIRHENRMLEPIAEYVFKHPPNNGDIIRVNDYRFGHLQVEWYEVVEIALNRKDWGVTVVVKPIQHNVVAEIDLRTPYYVAKK